MVAECGGCKPRAIAGSMASAWLSARCSRESEPAEHWTRSWIGAKGSCARLGCSLDGTGHGELDGCDTIRYL